MALGTGFVLIVIVRVVGPGAGRLVDAVPTGEG
jgi:hypothetical protein